MKVYLVGHSGPEHQWIEGVYKNKADALKAFEKIRLDLLEKAKSGLKWCKKEKTDGGWGAKMYKEIIKRLSEKNPDKINNYPQETPYIHEMELK